MSTPSEWFHETWMGMVQPIEGLVVTLPVLLEADIVARAPPAFHEHFRENHLPRVAKKGDKRTPQLVSVRAFVEDVLELSARLRDDAPPSDLSVYLPEGRETLTPTWAIRKIDHTPREAEPPSASYQLLAWELPPDVDLDRADGRDGVWAYPPRAKFDRLLRATGVPIGLLTNGRALRLVYAPQGESTGSITFRVADMEKADGRPIVDALVMLLHARRFDGAGVDRSLPELLAKSRKVQAEVSKELEAQVKAALERLLRGFEEAAERDRSPLVGEALAEGTLTHGLLTLLLRIVFVLFAEDRELLPIEHKVYREGMSVLGLFERLQAEAASYPDSMGLRFGAYGRLVSLFRAVFLGVKHGDLEMPPRYGDLFSPHRFPFLEGWGPAGGAPITMPEDRAKVRVPSVDDGCVFDVLHKLLYLRRERLSYRALDVEQIGSVYEGLIGYGVARLASPAVRLGPYDVWVTAAELWATRPAMRASWLKEKADLPQRKCAEIAAAVGTATSVDQAFSAMARFVRSTDDQASAGRLVLQPGPDRKHTSSHYTPRSLSEPIVEKTLRPLLASMGEAPSSQRILSLKVCDPAMGSGAFLVAACRFLGAELVAAWTREGVVGETAKTRGDVVIHARRIVAQSCLYGVDKNPFAVSLGKLSLWLATLAKDEPFTFVDHALRCGDSLVGLSFEQIEKFTWEPVQPTPKKPGQLQLDLFRDEISFALKDALAARQRIESLAGERSIEALKEKERWLDEATDALARVRLIGDLIVGAFFAHERPRDREAERTDREQKVRDWLRRGGPVPDDLAALAEETRRTLRPFHWAVEFPEIFFAERPDPLEANTINRIAFMDAFVGNPPFLGGRGVTEEFGTSYTAWLQGISPGAHGAADLVAHFFRRASTLLGKHGTIGFIATKTIAQGDTRAAALQPLMRDGLIVYDATRLREWPGEAAVVVSVVHLAKGNVKGHAPGARLDDLDVPVINSRLRAGEERGDPVPLIENDGKCFQGSVVVGLGFVLSDDERGSLVSKNARNAERIFPYIGGDEVNSSPTQTHDRYIINFGQMAFEEAKDWPDLLRIVTERVKPERDKVNREAHRKYWWRYGDYRPGLYAAIRRLPRCLVTSIVAKYVVFSFQPTDLVFSHKLEIFPFDDLGHFCVMQSRLHTTWAWLLSSTMGAGSINYSASDCFEPFPFPQANQLAKLEPAGRALYEARAAYMKDENVGLTTTYNRMKEPTVTDARIEDLRKLTIAMDRAVLAAYGWSDLEPPAFTTPVTDEDKRVQALFEDAVIDRLFALNAERASTQGAASRPDADGDGEDADTAAPAPTNARPRKRAKRKRAPARKTKRR